MATVVVKHHPSGGPADPLALVDGPTYDADPHIVTGLENVQNVDTTNAANVTFIQTGTGAVSRSLQSKARDFISALDFSGVDSTGLTDSTVGIAAAILATPAGGTLYFPAGTYLISGSGSAIFTITKPINIIGMGMTENATGSTFLLAAGVPTTRDIFWIVGVVDTSTTGYTFKNYNVAALGTSGKNVFHFDSTAGTTTNFFKVLIDNVFMQDIASAGGNSIFFDNGIGTNTNGGVVDSIVSNCYLGGGFSSSQTGDSIRLFNNLIHTATAGVIVNQVAGAGGFVMSGNNISGTGGGLIVQSAVAPYIGPANEFEQQITCTEANNSIVDFTGASGNISNPKIIGNLIQAVASVGNPTLIRIAAATGAVIDGNRLGTPAAYAHIINTAAASGTVIGAGNLFAGGGANITDSGAGTVYIPLSVGTATSLIGNPTGSVAAPIDIPIGSGLAISAGSLIADSTVVRLTATQSLSNKTLTASTATTFSLSASTGTLLGDANTGPTLALKPSSGGGSVGVSAITLSNFGAAASNQNILFSYNARGVVGTPTAVQANDPLFLFGVAGHDGTNIAGSAGYDAGIQVLAAATFTTSVHPTVMTFSTTPSSTKVIVEAMRIQASSGVSIGTTTDGGAKSLLVSGLIKSQDPTAGIGYATGAGSTVTQGTGRTTGVTINNVSGSITLFSQVNTAVSQATAQSFTVTNSAVAATDVPHVVQKSGTDKYEIFVTAVAAGSFQITNYAVAGTTNEAPVFNFVIIKGVAS